MENEIKIYEKGLENYPKSSVLFGNFMMLLWFATGAAACWFFHPLAAWIYIGVAFIQVYIVLRKLVCTNCYYYDRWCALGWGKLSALLFKKGSIENFRTCAGIKLAPPTYGLLALVPMVLLVISLVRDYSIEKALVLALMAALTFFTAFLSRKKTCSMCRMRLICPGSAVKKPE